MTEQNNNPGPAWKGRDGAVEATTWANSGQNGTFYRTDFERSYKDQEGNWQKSRSFSGTDLLKVQQLAAQAYQAEQQLKNQSMSNEQPQSNGSSIDAARAEMHNESGNGQDHNRGPER